MICGQCGDPLVKIPLVKPTQIFALIAAFAFITPFFLMLFGYFKDLNRPHLQETNEPIVFVQNLINNDV